jgi:hypothetical protein
MFRFKNIFLGGINYYTLFFSVFSETKSEYFLRAKLLRKLHNHNYYGGKHTAFDNLHRGFKKQDHNRVNKIAKELIKENYLLEKKAFYGLHVSLNPKKSKEIKKEIKEFFENFFY